MAGQADNREIEHGGNLAAASIRFPHAPRPWLDLSTGINPHSYSLLDLPANALTRLPEPSRLAELKGLAAEVYGAPSAAHIVAAPGTQILLPLVAESVPPGRAVVLGPTYAEHARAAGLAGHRVEETSDFNALYAADLAIVVNPNNPDGRIVSRTQLLDLADAMRAKNGMLVVDEAFMDVGPREESVVGDVAKSGLVVLRSFGKFYGLAGVRLGFALASEDLARRLETRLGPWAVAGPALEYGLAALADSNWRTAMRVRLAHESATLDALLARSGLEIAGGTSLYRFARHPEAQHLFEVLGGQGIVVRRFDRMPDCLRIGLPGSATEMSRLAAALARWPATERMSAAE